MNGVGSFPTPGYTPGYNPVVIPGYEPLPNEDDNDGLNRGGQPRGFPMMQHPRDDYTAGPDAQGNYPDIEEPIMASAAEEQEFINPFAGMFADSNPQRDSLYENQEKMAKYNDSFARRISNLSGDAVLSAFFDAVRNNDTEWVEPALKDKDITSPVRNEDNRRAALVLAIKNRHIEMVKLLLEHDAPIGNAFFHAAQVSSTAVVRILCDHLKGKKAILDSALNSFSEDADFSHITTPLMKASCDNDHEIVKMLVDIGAEMPTLEAVLARVGDSSIDIYERALARVYWHKAMSSEAYLLFGSEDPIRAAFEAGLSIEETAKDQLTHIKPQYKELIVQLDTFLTNYLEMTQNAAEISTLLTEATAKEEGDSMAKADALPKRLLYALDLKFQKFVAHNNCQQYVIDRWYLYHTEWEELPMFVFALRTALIFFLMPILCILYIIFPIRGVQRFMKMPFVRFVLNMASRIAFLIFLIYATISTATDEKIAAKGAEGGPTKTPEELEFERIEHFLEYRGCPSHFVVWLIYVWIFGNTWRELKELWRQGFKDYLSELFNWVDITQLGLYWLAIILNFVSYLQAAAHVKTHAFENWDSCAVEETEDFGSDYGGSPVERPPEDARAIHAKFECESRTDWNAFDPLLVSEGCFAMATVLTFLGALKDTVILSFVGPLRISLGGMILDIVRFFLLFFFLWISFSIGMTQLYETFMVLKTLDCEEGEDCHPAFLTFSRTMGTLFWSLFDLADTEELEVHPEAGMVFTETVGLILYASYLIIAVVVMLNALIAMMSNTYTRVEENSEIEWKVERTKLMVDYVSNCPTLPSPFNLIPTPKLMYRIFTRLYKCCFMRKSMKRQKLDEARDRTIRESQYKQFIQTLTDRYINGLRTNIQSEDNTERLQMDMGSLKEMMRMMRTQMLDIKTANAEMQNNVKNCVNVMDDMITRQKQLEEQQAKQLRLLRARRLGSEATPPPVTSPSPPPRSEISEEELQRNVAALDEAENHIRALAESLDDLPWIDSEV